MRTGVQFNDRRPSSKMVFMVDAFFTQVDDSTYLAGPHTEGPWEPGVQHGGPPAALVAREVERVPTSIGQPAQLARLTVEILGPVPVDAITVSGRVVRPGRSVELVEVELAGRGRVVIRAHAWRIRTAALELPPAPVDAPPLPAEVTEFTEPGFRGGFIAALEWRMVAGSFEAPGPATAWARLRVPLVAGEEPTGVQRLLALADCGNGLSSEYDFRTHWFINTELTVHLHRQPVGEWVCAHARSTLDTSGVGVADTELFDRTGRVGRGAQALMVGRR